MEEEKFENEEIVEEEEVKTEEKKENKKVEADPGPFWKGSKPFLLIAVILFLMLASFALGQISGITIGRGENKDAPTQIRNAGEGKYDIVESR